MSSSRRELWRRLALSLLALAWTVLPALAQEEHPPEPADSTLGFIFRWLNLALVLGAIFWAVRQYGAPYFRQSARAIADAIHGAAAARVSAERALSEATQQLASVDAKMQIAPRGARESASEAERLRALAQSEAEKIARAAGAEIEAAERLARQQLRGIAAGTATDRAAELVRQRMNDAADRALFGAFVGELERTAR
jgi:F0F1-type ATP synthase membrane subunit b/b'